MPTDVDKVREKLQLAIASGFDNAIDRYLEEFEATVAAAARAEALAPVVTAWKWLDRELNSCDYCSDPAVSNAADAVEAALGVKP